MNEKRLAQLQEMLRLEPNNTFLIYAIAQEHLSASDFAAACEWFNRLFSVHPDYLPTYYHYGIALLQTGQEAAAIDVWRKGASLAKEAGDRKTEAEIRELLSDFDEDENW